MFKKTDFYLAIFACLALAFGVLVWYVHIPSEDNTEVAYEAESSESDVQAEGKELFFIDGYDLYSFGESVSHNKDDFICYNGTRNVVTDGNIVVWVDSFGSTNPRCFSVIGFCELEEYHETSFPVDINIYKIEICGDKLIFCGRKTRLQGYEIVCLDLKTGEQKVISDDQGRIVEFSSYGNYVYYFSPGKYNSNTVCRYNIETEEEEILFSSDTVKGGSERKDLFACENGLFIDYVQWLEEDILNKTAFYDFDKKELEILDDVDLRALDILGYYEGDLLYKKSVDNEDGTHYYNIYSLDTESFESKLLLKTSDFDYSTEISLQNGCLLITSSLYYIYQDNDYDFNVCVIDLDSGETYNDAITWGDAE